MKIMEKRFRYGMDFGLDGGLKGENYLIGILG